MGNTRLWDPFWNEIAIFMVHQYPITILQKKTKKKNIFFFLAYVGPFVDYLWNNKIEVLCNLFNPLTQYQ